MNALFRPFQPLRRPLRTFRIGFARLLPRGSPTNRGFPSIPSGGLCLGITMLLSLQETGQVSWIPAICSSCKQTCGHIRVTGGEQSPPTQDTCTTCKIPSKQLAAPPPPPPPQPPPPPPPPPSDLSIHAQPTFCPPTEGVSDDLGISLNTFRELQLLQTREIGPEDYDLLMLLHARPNTKTLDEHTLCAVTEHFRASATHESSCPVCLGAMTEGEELCRLACEGRHVFHAHCITEWLRTASRCCPVDQQDLSARELS